MIKNLRLSCIIGVHPDERRKRRETIINIWLWVDFSRAERSDNLEDTMDYGELHDKLVSLVEGSEFRLMESLARRIADLCLDDGRVEKVKVRVEKPGAIKMAENAGVEIAVRRKDKSD